MVALLKTTQIQEPSSATVNLALDTSGGVTVGQNLTVTGNISVAGTGMAGRLIRAPQILTSGTSYTTPSNCTAIYVEAVGGGGNGGNATRSAAVSCAGGGGGGAYCASYFTVTASTAYTYAVGAVAGNTTFTVGATTITAGGGATANNNTDGTGTGGAGGTASNGNFNVDGQRGSNGHSATGNNMGGSGGSSFFGFGGPITGGALGADADGNAGRGYGAGGSGAKRYSGTGTNTGGAGTQGVIRIWEFT